jgi:hypothetical protein
MYVTQTQSYFLPSTFEKGSCKICLLASPYLAVHPAEWIFIESVIGGFTVVDPSDRYQ